MRNVVITGATSGIGLEIARILAQKGFYIIGIGHSEKNCKQAKSGILADSPDAKVTFFLADLMCQREILRLSKELTSFLNQNFEGKLNILINNAGCVRSWYMTTEDGYEQQFALNHLAGFLLTHELLPLLLNGNGRIIITGSNSHKGIRVNWDDIMLRQGYNPLTAYKQSKLCNILFARGLNDRYVQSGIHAYVVDPGLVNTAIGNKGTGGLVNFIWTLRKRHGVPPTVPAKTFAFLCEQQKAPGGLYYYQGKEKKYSRQVTRENADRLFTLSERLCGISYDKEKAK